MEHELWVIRVIFMKAFRLKILTVFAVVAVVVVLAAVLLLRPRPMSQKVELGRVSGTQTPTTPIEPEPNDPAYLAMKEKAEGPRQEIAEAYPGSGAAERADAVLSKLPQRYKTRTEKTAGKQTAAPRPVTLNEAHLPQFGEENALPPGLPDYIYERYGLTWPVSTLTPIGTRPDDRSAEMFQKLPDRYKKLLQDETGRINLDHIRKLSEEQRADSAVPPDTEQGRYHSADANEPPSRR